jgi:hypothetical protein
MEESSTSIPDSSLFQTIQVGTDSYLMCSAHTFDLFIIWWKTTTWYQHHLQDDASTLSINDFLSTLPRLSSVWTKFIVAIKKTTGQPVVICKTCSRVLTHPKCTGKNQGTSSMKTHLQARSCQQSNISLEGEETQPLNTPPPDSQLV